MSSELRQPIIAAHAHDHHHPSESNSANPPDPSDDLSEPHAPITDQEVGEYREQDRFLPIANVARIMKNSVPPTAKIAKDAKECLQECVSEFISFITSEAAEKCIQDKRKTIGGEDLLHAMTALGFENYSETLKIHLAKLRTHQHATGGAVVASSSKSDGSQND